MTAIYIIAAAILTGIGGAVAAKLASIRSWRQPIETCTADEDAVLEWLTRDLAQWVRAYKVLDGSAFSTMERKERWNELEQAAKAAAGPDLLEIIARAQMTRDDSTLEDVGNNLRSVLGGEALAHGEVEAYLRSGGNVISAAGSRAQNTERSPIEEDVDDDGVATLVRRMIPAGTNRLIGGGVAGACLGMAGALAVIGRFDGIALYAALVGAIVLGIGGVLVSFIDLDTFYLDTASFWAWAGASWVADRKSVV